MYSIVNKYTDEVIEDGFADMASAVYELQFYVYAVRILLTVRPA